MALTFAILSYPSVSRPPRIAVARTGYDGHAKRLHNKGSVVPKPGTPSIGVDLNEKSLPRAPEPLHVALAPDPAPAPKDTAPAPAQNNAVDNVDGKTTPSPLPIIRRDDFPDGFIFGAASSSVQVEGAWSEDGKGLSCWDHFIHERPEMIKDRSNAKIAIDFYRRYEEDLTYAQEANMDAYRFSISWPRILPKGSLSGGISKEGIAHYSRVIDSILKKGMKPYVTLYHWETPQELEWQYEGWLSQKFVDDYRDFVNICFEEFGDKVTHWITFNEPSLTFDFGYNKGILPPARCSSWMDGNCKVGDSGTEPYIAGHHLLLAHAAAVQLYRAKYKDSQKGEIGITLTSSWSIPYDNTSKADIDAARRFLDFHLGWFLDPITQGDYPYSMRATIGDRLPRFTRLQSTLLKGSYDFIGLNYYTSTYVQSQPFIPSSPGFSYDSDIYAQCTGVNSEGVQLGVPIGNHPEGLKRMLLYIKDNYNDPPLIITENGFKLPNVAEPIEKALNDQPRIDYHWRHLINIKEAIKEGAKVKGYFAWSLSDSFEWIFGYTIRFGLIYVDYDNDLKRYPKSSYTWFKKFLKRSDSDNGALTHATNNQVEAAKVPE